MSRIHRATALVVVACLAGSSCSADRADGIAEDVPAAVIDDRANPEQSAPARPGPDDDRDATDGGNAGPQSAIYFTTVPPGGELPSAAVCAQRVAETSDGLEPRPANTEFNTRRSSAVAIVDGSSFEWNERYASRVDGDFAGTTDDILRWGACKWGFDEDVTRARAVAESSWLMSTVGDETADRALCRLLDLDAPCAQSYGLLQVKGTVHTGTYPTSRTATAYGVDYAMAWLRACFDGAMPWLGPDYDEGDEWGCVGAWFSGRWKDQPAVGYIETVMGHLQDRTWEGYR